MNNRMAKFYMNVAKQCAEMSRAVRLKVGSVVIKNNNIISFSWNGMPAGWTNECEEKEWIIGNIPQKYKDDQWIFKEEDSGAIYRMRSKPEVIHAEANAIAKLARGSESGEGSTMFLTHAPCLDCAKQMYTAGINKVYFREQYRDTLGIDFLEQCGVEVEQCNIGENT